MGTMDLNRIDRLLLRENYLLGIGFLEGIVFTRVTQRSLIQLLYDPSQEGLTSFVNITAETFVKPQRFPSTDLSSTDIFRIEEPFQAYQMFLGISPSASRVFTRIEAGDKNELDEGNWGQNDNYRFGYIDGYNSPLNNPAPESERILVKDIQYEYGLYNPYKYTISPLFKFIINRIEFSILKDANLVQKILAGATPARIIYMGGIDAVKFQLKKAWTVSPVAVDATLGEIKKALGDN